MFRPKYYFSPHAEQVQDTKHTIGEALLNFGIF